MRRDWPYPEPRIYLPNRRTGLILYTVKAAPKIVVEKHSDGYVAYPLGLARGAVLGQGDTYEEALADVRSAIAFHAQTFGPASLAPLLHLNFYSSFSETDKYPELL